MKWFAAVLSMLVIIGFSNELWFDFTTPIFTYFYASIKDATGIGLGIGGKIGKLPEFEISYINIRSESNVLNYVCLKPLIFRGRIKEIGKRTWIFGDVGMGFDVSVEGMFEDYGVSVVLTSGIGAEYSNGIIARGKIEIVLRMNVLNEMESPYYIHIFGPISFRPSILLGGKF